MNLEPEAIVNEGLAPVPFTIISSDEVQTPLSVVQVESSNQLSTVPHGNQIVDKLTCEN